MKDTIYLIAEQNGITGMRKSIVDVRRGQTLIKVDVSMDSKAFEPPIITKEIHVVDWRKDIDMEDVEFREKFITEEEAKFIREKRIEKMKEILERQGYSVAKLEEKNDSNNP